MTNRDLGFGLGGEPAAAEQLRLEADKDDSVENDTFLLSLAPRAVTDRRMTHSAADGVGLHKISENGCEHL